MFPFMLAMSHGSFATDRELSTLHVAPPGGTVGFNAGLTLPQALIAGFGHYNSSPPILLFSVHLYNF